MIDFINEILLMLRDVLERINDSSLPEQAGIVLAKGVRFFVDYIAPLINNAIVVIFNR